MATALAGGPGLGQHRLEVAPLGVAEEVLEVAGEPVVDPVLGLLGVSLERGRQGPDDGGLHGRGPFLRRCDPGSYSTGSLDEVPHDAGAATPRRTRSAAAPPPCGRDILPLGITGCDRLRR